jgi:hypothetical protein
MHTHTNLTALCCSVIIIAALLAQQPPPLSPTSSPLPTPTLQLTPPFRPTPTGWFSTPHAPRLVLRPAVFLPILHK